MVSNCSESHLPGSEPRMKSGGSGDSIAHGSVAKHIITETSAKERIMPEKIYPCACVTSVRSRRAQLPLTLVRRCSIGRRWARKRPHQQHSKHMIHRHTLAGARGKALSEESSRAQTCWQAELCSETMRITSSYSKMCRF